MIQSYPRIGGYNELVLSASRFDTQLPAAVEAFFYLRTPECEAAPWCKARAERAHRTFTLEYGIASDAPLLSFDAANWEAPFAPPGPVGVERTT